MNYSRMDLIMIKRKLLASCFAFAVMAPTYSLASQITLSTSSVYFDLNKQEKKTVSVMNVDKGTNSYFEVVVNEVINPGKNEILKKVINPAQGGIIVTPSKSLVRKGDSSRVISVINLNEHLEKERVYRVDVKPVISGIENMDADQKAVKLLLGYDILVHIQPNFPTFFSTAKINGNELVVSNIGNTHFVIADLQACNALDVCTELKGGNLYSGVEGRVGLPADTTKVVFYKAKRGSEKEKVIVLRQ